VYIVVLNVLYDDVYLYKSLQITYLFCSVLTCMWTDRQVFTNHFSIVYMFRQYC